MESQTCELGQNAGDLSCCLCAWAQTSQGASSGASSQYTPRTWPSTARPLATRRSKAENRQWRQFLTKSHSPQSFTEMQTKANTPHSNLGSWPLPNPQSSASCALGPSFFQCSSSSSGVQGRWREPWGFPKYRQEKSRKGAVAVEFFYKMRRGLRVRLGEPNVGSRRGGITTIP